jgi:porin
MKTKRFFRIGALSGTLTGLLSSLVAAGPGDPVSPPDLLEPLCEGRLMGDVWGLRNPAETGIDFRLEALNFYHGVIDGTGGDDMEGNGKLELFINMDGQKAGLWPGLFVNVHGEFRYGSSPGQAGVIGPVNSAMVSPGFDGEIFAFTNVTITQALSQSFMLTIGKFNTFDLDNKHFYGGRGTERFMNANLLAMPMIWRTVPLAPLGIVGTYLRDGKPFVNFGVFDAISPITSAGWDELSADEMTFYADIVFNTKFGGLDGWHTFTGTYSTVDVSPLVPSGPLQPPEGGGVEPNVDNDSWHINYIYEQYLMRESADSDRGLGSFLLLGVSDGNPNPLAFSAAAGLVAKGVCGARSCDSYGVGLFFNSISGDLNDTLSGKPVPGIDIQDEFGGEIYYNMAITPWFNISADLQVIQPMMEDNDTAIFGGFRSRIVF